MGFVFYHGVLCYLPFYHPARPPQAPRGTKAARHGLRLRAGVSPAGGCTLRLQAHHALAPARQHVLAPARQQ